MKLTYHRNLHSPTLILVNLVFFLILSISLSLLSYRVYHSAKVNIYGVPFIREMPKIKGVSGTDLVVKCPVAGHPIDKIHWERGNP